ncbi:MAG: N-acetyltransferase [Alphaproteobacteria bacterium]|nr:N-acetyltransferase [Alphaproteobacteria bacterium]
MTLPAYTFRPVTSENVEDFVALFAARGGPGHCWCMVWRGSPAEKHEQGGSLKKAQMLGRIEAGIPVGLLGYEGERPRVWVSIAPRDTHIKLGGPEARADERAWSLTCMFVPRDLRTKGLASVLIAAAVDHARAEGATSVEAYPVRPDSPSFRFMGRVSSFEKAGFRFIGMAGTRRHVMRLGLC